MFSFGRENTGLVAKWWRNIDKQILFSIIFLFLLGLLFSFSSTSQIVGEKLNKETYFLFIKHFVFVIISINASNIVGIAFSLDVLTAITSAGICPCLIGFLLLILYLLLFFSMLMLSLQKEL